MIAGNSSRRGVTGIGNLQGGDRTLGTKYLIYKILWSKGSVHDPLRRGTLRCARLVVLVEWLLGTLVLGGVGVVEVALASELMARIPARPARSRRRGRPGLA